MSRTHYIYIIALLLLVGVAAPMQAQTIRGNIYGGGEIAKVEGDTHVDLNTGTIHKDVFGGGKGVLKDDHTVLASADVTGTTNVTASGSTFAFPTDGIDAYVNHNVYGGGNLACEIGGNTNVTMNVGILPAGFFESDSWTAWKRDFDRQDDNVAQGSVFGAGYGVHTNVVGTATIMVKANSTSLIDVIGGSYNGTVAGSTDVTVQSGYIYKVYGGGLGSYAGYEEATTQAMKDLLGSVGTDNGNGTYTGGTNVTINGGKFYNNIFGGGAGLKYKDGTSYLNVAKVNGTAKVTIDAIGGWSEEQYAFSNKIYGGGALGLVNDQITVEVKSGWIVGGDVFAGSLGEMGHLDKALVANGASVKTIANESDPVGELNGRFNIYGGCDMAQLTGNTHVDVLHGTFSGNIFGGGKGVYEVAGTSAGSEQYLDYGKVTGNTNIQIDAPDIVLGEDDVYDTDGNITEERPKIGIYGGGALGLVVGTINPVTLKSGTIYGEVFGGSLGEKGYLAKAKVTGNTSVVTAPNDTKDSDGVTPKPDALNGKFNIYGGCELAWVEGNTAISIGHGDFSGKIFGGGKGLAYAKAGGETDYGKISGVTEVNYQSDGSFNGDIYGGGALGLVTPTGTPEYTTQVNLYKGELNGQVFGGGFGEIDGYDSNDENTWAVLNTAKVTGNTKVETAGTEDLTGDINHVYGGGDMAMVDGNTKLIITHGRFSGSIFGGGHGVPSEDDEEYMDFGKVTGNTDVLIDGPNLQLGLADTYDETSAAAANDASGATLGHANYVQAGDLIHPMNIYGGGALGIVNGNINVSVRSGNINGAVFAGSLGEEGHVNKAKVTTNATIKTEVSETNKQSDGVTPAALTGNIDIYGACDMAQLVGDAQVTVKHGDFTGRIFGGGKGLPTILAGGVDTNQDYGKVIGKSNVLYDSDGTFEGSIYGGGALGLVERVDGLTPTDKSHADYYITKVRLKKGTINNGYVFGGSLGEKTNPEKAMIHGNTLVVTEDVTDPATEVLSGNINHVYGGGDMAQVTGDTEVKITHGSFTGDIYGGGNGRLADSNGDNINLGKVIGNSLVTIDGTGIELGEEDEYDASGNITKENPKINVYGGGALGIVTYDATVNMENGTVVGKIYGGSFGEEGYAEKAMVQNETHVNINGGTITGDVFGGGALAKVDKDTYVNINGGSVSHEVYGGGALADVNQNTYVYLFGGTVHDVYGGGLGQLEDAGAGKQAVEAFVKGNTLVQLGHETTTPGELVGSKVTGSIFGCNNVNGTPKGHAKVHVLKTTYRGDGVQSSPKNAEGVETSYDVLAVYGGGNKAAYQPWTQTEIASLGAGATYTYKEEFAEVLIENCDNSIAYVYGGGNAAPVPATKVTIYGADAINHAFAGGNGKTKPGQPQNPGADIGYLGYHSSGHSTPYGSGLASITVYGGTVHNVYGGSNTLGYIRGGTSISVSEAAGACELNVGNVFGGGNEADIDCSVTMTLDCTEGGAILYAGANNANVNGDITLNIHSGIYGKVFCGNNTGGKIYGKLEVNVDETSECWPVMIGELYGCGNMAPYSVYGYKDNGDLRTKKEYEALSDADKIAAGLIDENGNPSPYKDPTVNLISFTRIGKVFGGGYGETAVLYGNTKVSVEPIPGRWAGETLTPVYVLNGDDERVLLSEAETLPHGITKNDDGSITIDENAISIGSIYGGGNAGAVYGDTFVNIGIGNDEHDKIDGNVANHHISGNDKTTLKEVAVTITGNVFGGGNEAIVSGNTNVKIGEE